MNFELTEEQRMIQESVARFVEENYDLESRVASSAKDPGFSSDHWNTMAELGWLGLPFAESDGGFLAYENTDCMWQFYVDISAIREYLEDLNE